MLAKLVEDDATLLRRYARDRDEEAFAELVRRYRAMVLGVARRVTGNVHDAEDVAQAAFLELAADAKKVRSNVPGWLRAVTVRRAHRWKQEIARRAIVESLAAEEHGESSVPSRDDLSLVVRMSVDELPEYERIPFKLRYYDGLTLDEVAALVRDNRRSVTRRIEAAVEKLQRTFLASGAIATPAALAGALTAAEGVRPTTALGVPVAQAGAKFSASASLPRLRPLLPKFPRPLWAKSLLAAVMMLLSFAAATAILPRGSLPWQSPGAFDLIRASYAPHVDLDDPVGFSAKIASMSADRYAFWDGSRVPFLEWCEAHAPDWLAEGQPRVLSPGRVGLESVGAYATNDEQGRRGHEVGLIDHDDSARLPPQVDLLQALVALRLAADRNGVPVDEPRRRELTAALVDAYRRSYAAPHGSPVPREGQSLRQTLLSRAASAEERMLERYVRGGRFRPEVESRPGRPPERLFPAAQRSQEVAAALGHTLRRSHTMRRAFRPALLRDGRISVKDVARRAGGDGGLKEYLVLLDRPLRGVDHDVIVRLRRQIPAAAERQGLWRDPRLYTPARRAVEDATASLTPWPYVIGWCQLGDGHYQITLAEPEERRLVAADVPTFESLLDAATLLGHLLGRTHRTGQDTPSLPSSFSADSVNQLLARADQFIAHHDGLYGDFRADDRVREHVERHDRIVR